MGTYYSRLSTPKEIATVIKESINPRKAAGFDLNTRHVLKQFPRKVITKLTYLINATIQGICPKYAN